jgi:hypothetical protein
MGQHQRLSGWFAGAQIHGEILCTAAYASAAILTRCRWTATGGVTRELKKLEAAKQAKEEMANMNKRQYN